MIFGGRDGQTTKGGGGRVVGVRVVLMTDPRIFLEV